MGSPRRCELLAQEARNALQHEVAVMRDEIAAEPGALEARDGRGDPRIPPAPPIWRSGPRHNCGRAPVAAGSRYRRTRRRHSASCRVGTAAPAWRCGPTTSAARPAGRGHRSPPAAGCRSRRSRRIRARRLGSAFASCPIALLRKAAINASRIDGPPPTWRSAPMKLLPSAAAILTFALAACSDGSAARAARAADAVPSPDRADPALRRQPRRRADARGAGSGAQGRFRRRRCQP